MTRLCPGKAAIYNRWFFWITAVSVRARAWREFSPPAAENDYERWKFK